jgi:hypothetical protein
MRGGGGFGFARRRRGGVLGGGAVVPDTICDAFTLNDVGGAPLATLETSNTITVAGLGAGVSVLATISGDASSQMQKNGGAWVAGPVSVVNTDTLAVRHTSSASNSTAVNTTLSIGGVSDTYTSTTAAAAGPSITSAPVLSGPAVVGQRQLAAPGTYSTVPVSVTGQWKYEGGANIPDATLDNYQTRQFDVGLKVYYVETADFGGGVTSPMHRPCPLRSPRGRLARCSSPAPARPAQRRSPIRSRRPPIATPGTWLFAEVATDSTFATITQAVVHMLTLAEIATPSTISFAGDGFTDPGSTEVMRVRLVAQLEDDTTLNIVSQIIGKNYTPVAVFDNFDDGIKDPTKWGADANWQPGTTTSGAVAEVNSVTRFTVVPGVAGNISRPSLNAASFTGKFVQLERMTGNQPQHQRASFGFGVDANNGYRLLTSGGNIFLQGKSAGASTNINSFADPDYGSTSVPATYRHLRLRHDTAAGV